MLLLATLPALLLTLLLLPSDICSQPALLLAAQAFLPTPVLLSLPQLLLLLLRLPALMLFAGTSFCLLLLQQAAATQAAFTPA
jgi:hypothetical protein